MFTVILTGGMSRRMGRDKATLPLGGDTMSQLLIKKYAAVGDVAVSVDRAGRFPHNGALELVDEHPGMGPINGIISAFSQTAATEIFLTATDLPYGDVQLAQHLVSQLDGCDACVIKHNGRAEPLFAAYSRASLTAARECLESEERALKCVLEKLNIRYLSPSDLQAWDLERILLNINTPEQLQRQQKCN